MKLKITCWCAVLSLALFACSRREPPTQKDTLHTEAGDIIVVGGGGAWTSVTRARREHEPICAHGAKPGEQPVIVSGWECECGKRYITTIYWNSNERCDVYTPCHSCGKTHTIK